MRDTHTTFEVYTGRKVYEFSIRELDKKPVIVRKRKKQPPKILPVETDTCESCGGVRFNNICMTRDCPTNPSLQFD